MLRRLPSVVLVLIAITALAADEQSVPAPHLEAGDCWSFRADKLENRGPIGDYEECITHIDWQKGVIIAVAKLKDSGREIDTSYTTEWISRISVEGTITTGRKSARARIFPLRVGDTWRTESEFRRALLGPNAGETIMDVKVVGWEDITVPAGKFRALKIEGRGMVRRFDERNNFGVRSASWYVPEVNRSVKFWFENSDGRRGAELTGYRLTK